MPNLSSAQSALPWVPHSQPRNAPHCWGYPKTVGRNIELWMADGRNPAPVDGLSMFIPYPIITVS